MESFKIIPAHSMQNISPKKYLKVSKSRRDRQTNTTTQAWSTIMISLMDGEELSGQIIIPSLMDNGKMERDMDTLDILIMMVSVSNRNIKMANFLEMFEFVSYNKSNK